MPWLGGATQFGALASPWRDVPPIFGVLHPHPPNLKNRHCVYLRRYNSSSPKILQEFYGGPPLQNSWRRHCFGKERSVTFYTVRTGPGIPEKSGETEIWFSRPGMSGKMYNFKKGPGKSWIFKKSAAT